MTKMLQFHEEALRSVLKGVKTLSKAVIVTLGPRGRNVVINKGMGSPLSTKDGVTVAKEISLKDKFENMGAQLVKEAASKRLILQEMEQRQRLFLRKRFTAQALKM